MRRVLRNKQFTDGEFDTSFIEQNQESLLAKTRDASHMRMGTVAIVKTFLESIKFRAKRRSPLDPWTQRDMFRMNQKPIRDLTLVSADGTDEHHYLIEYVKENVFNCYYRDNNGFLTSVIVNAEVQMNPERPDDLIVRTDSEQYKVDYYMDNNDEVI